MTWGMPRLMAFSAVVAIVAGFYAASQGQSLLLAAFWSVALVLTAICQEMCDSNRRAAALASPAQPGNEQADAGHQTAR